MVTAQLMSATKIVGQYYTNFQASCNFPCLYILVCFRSGQKPQRHAFSLGLTNDLFLHLCIKEGADQLRSYRAANQRFCFRFIEHISRHCECMHRNFQLEALNSLWVPGHPCSIQRVLRWSFIRRQNASV